MTETCSPRLRGRKALVLLAWCRTHMLRPDCPLVSPADMDLPHGVDDGPAIVRIIRDHHERWKKARDQNG